jgi:hypothetical protein
VNSSGSNHWSCVSQRTSLRGVAGALGGRWDFFLDRAYREPVPSVQDDGSRGKCTGVCPPCGARYSAASNLRDNGQADNFFDSAGFPKVDGAQTSPASATVTELAG